MGYKVGSGDVGRKVKGQERTRSKSQKNGQMGQNGLSQETFPPNLRKRHVHWRAHHPQVPPVQDLLLRRQHVGIRLPQEVQEGGPHQGDH